MSPQPANPPAIAAVSPIRRFLSLLTGGTPAAAAPIAQQRIAPAHIGRGFVDPKHRAGVRRIVVTVDDAIFVRVRTRAVERKVSLAAAVRELVERGLERSP